MSRLTALLANLPTALNKEPKGVSAVSISFASGATFVVKDLTLKSIPPSGAALNISLKDITFTTLVASINAVAGYTATVLGGLGPVKAYSLVEGTYPAPGGVAINLPYFSSPNWQLLAPLGVTLDTLDNDWNEAQKQTDLRRASGVWLDRIGLVYGITRTANEVDSRYARRLAASAIAAKCNGYAIAAIIQTALGASASVKDTGPAAFSATIDIDLSAGNPYDTAALNNLLNTYKAFGTIATLALRSVATDVDNGSTNTDSLISGTLTGLGEFGGPEWATRESGL